MTDNRINFFSEETDFEIENKDAVRQAISEYVRSAGNDTGTVNYIFCTDEYLLQLNKKYLNHDFYTDILAFQMNDDPIEGDIFISIERVKDNAEQLGTGFEDELLRVISHGILHFLGYKDKTEEQKKLMREKENELMTLIKKTTKHGSQSRESI